MKLMIKSILWGAVPILCILAFVAVGYAIGRLFEACGFDPNLGIISLLLLIAWIAISMIIHNASKR